MEKQLLAVAEVRYLEVRWNECIWNASGKLNAKDKNKFLAALLEVFKILPLIRGKIELIPYDALSSEVYFLSNQQLHLDHRYGKKLMKRDAGFRKRNPGMF